MISIRFGCHTGKLVPRIRYQFNTDGHHSPDGFTSSGGMFRCMVNKEEWPAWVFFEPPYNNDMHAKRAIEAIQHFNYPYPSGEFCVGWSDFYHIPRRFWADWIFLSGFFNDFGVFQEVAIPTMMHIIDSSRRLHPTQSVMQQYVQYIESWL